MINRPMLAPNYDYSIQSQFFTFPNIASPKKDGFRCYKKRGQALTRSGKLHPNPHVVEMIASGQLPDGLDGELISSDFRTSQSALTRGYGTPDFKYYLFDYVKDNLNKPYTERIYDLNCLSLPEFCIILPQYTINCLEDLGSFEEWCLNEGDEGFMTRKPDGIYKCGRSTLKQGLLLKGKRFTDAEAIIVGIHEQMQNNNEAFENELGYTSRSSHQENKVGKGIMGRITVRDLATDVVFDIGTGKGWTIPFRTEMLLNKDKYLNKAIITYKHLPHGGYDAPRNASMKCFREDWDLS